MEKTLHAGFARMEITPVTASVPLAGHDASEFRMSARVETPLYAHVIALANGEERCLYICTDLLYVPEKSVAYYRAAIGEATGLPAERIFLSATHTHSGPDLASSLPSAVQYHDEFLRDRLVEGAKRALADLRPAKLSYGATTAGHPGAWLNFDRHYYSVPIEKKYNYTPEDLVPAVGEAGLYVPNSGYCPVRHVEEADHSMQVIRLDREAADDIILVNFAAHSTFADTIRRPCVNADHPGELVKRLEFLLKGTKCVYFQGCCGNLVPCTFLEEEGIWGVTYPQVSPIKGIGKTHVSQAAYGAMTAGCAFKVLTQGMKPSGTDTLSFTQHKLMGRFNHRWDGLLDKAKQVMELLRREGSMQAVLDLCEKFGVNSPHTCHSIIRLAELPEKGPIELNAIRLGDVAIATIPSEPFSSIGEHIKAASPFAMTFVNGYSCGYQCYFPNRKADPNCYEVSWSLYMPGTDEEIENELTGMLKELC